MIREIFDWAMTLYHILGVPQWCGTISTAFLFSALAYKILKSPDMPSPRREFKKFFCWAIYIALHVGGAVSTIAYLYEHIGGIADWHMCGIRFACAASLLWRWNRRKGDVRI